MTDLEDGFYWVNLDGLWTVSEKRGGSFYVRAEYYWYQQCDFQEIDQRRIVREGETK